MIKNYLVIALRNFWKHRVFSIINISGLAIGMSAALVIYLLVSYEFSFDTFHRGRERMYRVVSRLNFPDMLIHNSGVSSPLPAAVKREVTGIEVSAALHLYHADTRIPRRVSSEQAPLVFKNQRDIIFTEPDYFRLFDYKWLAGSPGTLDEPFRVVIAESRARVYFPGKDIASIPGSAIVYNDSITATVTGIVSDFDQPTDISFKEFISLPTVVHTGLKKHMSWEDWGSVNSSSQFFLRLNKGVTAAQVNRQLASLRSKYAKDDYMKTENLLQSFTQLHFTSDYDMFAERLAHKPALYGLLAVAAFLLLLGCINFINLTTAQSAARAREIGIRKTMGSSRAHLVGQFLGETFLLTFVATILSVIITPAILKIFGDFIPPELRFDITQHPGMIIFIIVLMIVVTILSGFYPAMVLSGLKPARVIKKQSQSQPAKTRRALLRRSLTVSQFVIAQFLIIATILVAKQINFAISKEMGFRKEAIINIHTPWNEPDKSKRQVMLQKIQALPGVSRATLGGSTPAAFGYSTSTMKYKNGKKELETSVETKYADSTYFGLYDMKLAAGRWPRPSDSASKEFAINETFARFLGFKTAQEAIGQVIERGDDKMAIAGVIRDFHARSVHSAIKPLAYAATTANYSTLHILLASNNSDKTAWKNTIDQIEKDWKQIYPKFDFNYAFFDKTIESFYQSEKNISRLLLWATGLAIFISCLGMLGLVIYTTAQRTKEIGVRKVLGASVAQIVSLLSKDFLRLVVLAFVIASPLAWWATHKWLEDFAYRTPVSWWVFAAGGLMMIVIAMFTLSIQTIRSALANPVTSLRTE